MSVKRYSMQSDDVVGSYPEEAPNGDWVEWEDYEALRAERDQQAQRIGKLEGLLNRVRQADALSHACPLWKAIDAALGVV